MFISAVVLVFVGSDVINIYYNNDELMISL